MCVIDIAFNGFFVHGDWFKKQFKKIYIVVVISSFKTFIFASIFISNQFDFLYSLLFEIEIIITKRLQLINQYEAFRKTKLINWHDKFQTTM